MKSTLRKLALASTLALLAIPPATFAGRGGGYRGGEGGGSRSGGGYRGGGGYSGDSRWQRMGRPTMGHSPSFSQPALGRARVAAAAGAGYANRNQSPTIRRRVRGRGGWLRQSQPGPRPSRGGRRGRRGRLRQSQPGHRPSRGGWRGRRGWLRQSQPGHRPSRSGWRGRRGRLRQSQPVRPVPPWYGVRQLRTLRLCRGHGWLWRLGRLWRLWLRQWRRSMGHGLTDVRLGLLKL